MSTVPVDPLPTKPASGTLADATEVKSKFDTLFNYLAGNNAESDLFKAGAGIFDSYKLMLMERGNWQTPYDGSTPCWFSGPGQPISSGTSPGSPNLVPNVLDLVAADQAVSQKTLKLKLRVSLQLNAAVGPGTQTFTFGLYPIASVGGGSFVSYTLGSVVAGSTCSFVNPTAGTKPTANSGDFSLPADGLYVIGATWGVIPSGCAINASMRLLLRAV